MDFWTSFQASAGMYGVGEVYDGRVNFVASYQGVILSTCNCHYD